MINENQILELIGVQMQTIIDSDEDTYGGYTFTITNELQFVKDKKNAELLKNNPKNIFIVVKYLPSSLNFGQVLMPISINVVAEQNKIDVCRSLLIAYAETFNLVTNDDETIRQYYSTPYVLSNFNEIGNGYRSLINMTATFQISEKPNSFKIYLVENGENNTTIETQIETITQAFNFDVQLDSQVFYGVSNYTKSRGKVGTRILNFTCYLMNVGFINKILQIMNEDTSNMPNGVDSEFTLSVKFKNGVNLENKVWKLSNATIQQNIGELPVVSITMTN